MATPQITDRGVLLVEKEVTKGTDPTPQPSANAVKASKVTHRSEQKSVEVEALAPFADGAEVVPGPRSAGLAFEMAMYPVAIADANSRPHGWAVLEGLGFAVPTYAAGPPKTLSAARLSGALATVTMWRYFMGSVTTNGTVRKFVGCYLDGGLEHDATGLLMAKVSKSVCMSMSREDAALPTGVVFVDTNTHARAPFLAQKAAITSLTNGTVAFSGKVLGLKLNFNNQLEELYGLSASPWPDDTLSIPSIPTGTLTVREGQVADYDWEARQAAGDRFTFVETFTALSVGGSTTDTLAIHCPFYITGIKPKKVGKIEALDIEFKATWTALGTPDDPVKLVYTSTA